MSNFGVIRKIKQYDLSHLYDNLLYLLIITAPISVYGFLFFGMSVRLGRVCIFLLIPLLILRLLEKPNLILRDKFFMYCAFPYMVFATFSILWAPVEVRSFSLNRIGAFFEVMLVYVVLIAADIDIIKFPKVIRVYFLSAVVPILVSFWQLANNLYGFSKAELPLQSLFIAGKYEIYKDRSKYFLDGGSSRISSTLAEPTIFGSFLSSVLLLSMLIKPQKRLFNFFLKISQLIIACCIFLTLSKMAILVLVVGLFVIFRKDKKIVFRVAIGTILFVLILFFYASVFNANDFIARRFFTDSGHLNLLITTLNQLKSINLIIGEGIGSIPNFSTNKFLLSRIYETGVIGLIFGIQATFLPLIIFPQEVSDSQTRLIRDIGMGVITAIVVALHLYDLFIYIWPWIVIGLMMSFFNNLKSKKLSN